MNNINETILNQMIERGDPVHMINEKEFDIALLRFGSFLSITKNKRINHTALLALILEHENYMSCLKSITDIDNVYDLLMNLLERHPILCKSKIVKNKINELFDHSAGKVHL